MIEWKTEEWALVVLQGQQPENIPADFLLAHHVADGRAKSSRIVVTAKTEEQDKGGAKPYPVSLVIDLYVVEKDAAKLETISHAIRAAFAEPYSALAIEAAEGFFSYFEIDSQKTDDPEISNNTRQRTRELSILAKELVD